METTKPTEKPLHPYAKKLDEKLNVQRKMLQLLERKHEILTARSFTTEVLAGADVQTMSLNQINDNIELIRVTGEIETLKRVIHEKEQYFKHYMVQFEKDEADMLKHWNHTLAIAKKSTKPNIQRLLQSADMQYVESDIETKIAFYKQLRKHV